VPNLSYLPLCRNRSSISKKRVACEGGSGESSQRMAFVNDQAVRAVHQENEGVGAIYFIALVKHWATEAIGFGPNKVMRVGKQMLAVVGPIDTYLLHSTHYHTLQLEEMVVMLIKHWVAGGFQN